MGTYFRGEAALFPNYFGKLVCQDLQFGCFIKQAFWHFEFSMPQFFGNSLTLLGNAYLYVLCVNLNPCV